LLQNVFAADNPDGLVIGLDGDGDFLPAFAVIEVFGHHPGELIAA
jgi:hypothetical protein